MSEKKNILLLIPTFADEGGTQKMVYELGRLLSEKYKVFECSFDAAHEAHIFKNENEVLSLDSPQPASKLAKIFSYPKKTRKLTQLKKKYAIDITISNLWSADLVNALSIGSKRVSIGHVNIRGNFQNRLLLRMRRLGTLIYGRFDKTVAVNQYLRDELKEVFKLRNGKVTYINNFIDLPEDKPSAITKPAGKKRLVNFGRLNAIKNHEPLIKAFSQLKRKTPAQLVIIGAGPKMDELTVFTKALGLTVANDANDVSSDVIFTGFHPDPFSVLKSSDLFVFSSRSEGFGLVLVEAMHAGLPIVTSDCPTGGPHVILEGKGVYAAGRKDAEETPYGYLMPVPELNDGSVDIWEKIILQLLSDDEKRSLMKKNVKKRAQDFSKENIKKQWFELIESL